MFILKTGMWLLLQSSFGVGLWVIGGGVLLLLTLIITSRLRSKPRKRDHYDVSKQQSIAEIVAEALPLHPSSGWTLECGDKGMRVFTRQLSSLHQYSNTKVVASSLILDITAKRALSLISSPRELPCWFYGFPYCNSSPPTVIQQPSQNSHVIQFTVMNWPSGLLCKTLWTIHSRIAKWTAKYAPFLEELVTVPHTIVTESLERYWCSRTDGLSYVFSQPKSPSTLPFTWCCTYFTSLKQPGVCLATMVMCPLQEVTAVSTLITGQLCAIREHVTMRSFKVYSCHHPKSTIVTSEKSLEKTASRVSGSSEEEKHVENVLEIPSKLSSAVSSIGTCSVDISTGPPTPPTITSSITSSSASSASPEDILNAQYLNMATECTNKLVSMAKEGTQEGWLEVGTTKNVQVMKKLPMDKEPPINSIKGTGIVKAPPEFLLRLLEDPTHTTTLDDMLKETRILHKLTPAVSLVQLLYKAVWPTSPRDFAVLSIAGQVDSSTWISSGMSITDHRIPQEKGYVRADLLGGGYVINSVAGQAESSVVTYAACVNLKGSIPAFAVNKIAESQPMCVHRLRSLAEPLYLQMKSEPQKLASFEEKYPVPQVSETTVPSPLEDRLTKSQWHFDPDSNDFQEADRHENRFQTPPINSDDEVSNSDNLVPNGVSQQGPRPCTTPPLINTNSTPQGASLSSAALQLSPYVSARKQEADSDSLLQSITMENIYYPRNDSGAVDYRTMANQTAAQVLEEVFHVSGLDLLDPSTYTDQPTGGWSFSGLEKDVLMLTKTTGDQPFSCFMGKGIIPLTPQFVFNSLRNPQLRFMYDNMLKDLHIVKNIEEGLFILHLQHETTQCFIKQARDFCILVSERCEPNKMVLTGRSVETQDCPPDANLHRGKIHCSGWVVEPKQVKGKLCSEVTYLLQVDIGGVPSSLVNFISRRQPLAVAYLRDYLVSTSIEQSLQIPATL